MSRREDEVQLHNHRNKGRDHDPKRERHVRGLGHPEQAALRKVQREVRTLLVSAAALAVTLHAVDGRADKHAHPEKVEACNERVSIVHVVFEEQREEATADENGDDESSGDGNRAEDPDACDEGENAGTGNTAVYTRRSSHP